MWGLPAGWKGLVSQRPRRIRPPEAEFATQLSPANRKSAPAIGADVAFHDLAGAGFPEQTTSGASQPVRWLVLILRVGLRHLRLRWRRRDREAKDPAGKRRQHHGAP